MNVLVVYCNWDYDNHVAPKPDASGLTDTYGSTVPTHYHCELRLPLQFALNHIILVFWSYLLRQFLCFTSFYCKTMQYVIIWELSQCIFLCRIGTEVHVLYIIILTRS